MDSDGEAGESDHDSVEFEDEEGSDFEEGYEFMVHDRNRIVGGRQNYGDGWTAQPNQAVVNQFNFTEHNVDYAQQSESQWFKTFMSGAIVQWYL